MPRGPPKINEMPGPRSFALTSLPATDETFFINRTSRWGRRTLDSYTIAKDRDFFRNIRREIVDSMMVLADDRVKSRATKIRASTKVATKSAQRWGFIFRAQS